ncbi:CYFA0S01e04060g1_1 [Cyberlindnera fabianii]|uniref:Ribosomal RNA-processing protein 41 n=1 Tax=Cyberlindnera fabianii TaxID=36022 RepID=A0A061AGN0_CYBFA|nr:Exosome complex component SKI6 [Cyberlindnera fabianii]CDR36741.1 CYFA0S01e04060g1_1 [Cyberlindnera fabianii]
MSKQEIYSPEGLRIDGRRWNELRRFECRINTHPNSSDGSSYVEQGNSKTVCIVQGPMEPSSRANMSSTQATLNISLNVTPFSSIDRKKKMRNERRIMEIVTSLKRTFEQSIITEKYPRTEISISVHVLALDGGLISCVTNAITLALIDAGIAMYDYISSVSAGFYDNTPLLDLNSLEENDVSFLTIGVVGKSEKLALLILENKIPLDKLESVLAIAVAGGHRVRDMMDKEVRRHGELRLSKLANK